MPTIFGKLLVSTPRFLKIDDQNRGDHSHLTAADECYFLYEYTSRRNYSFSSTNQLISNLKKKPSQASANEYRYKLDAMQACTRDLKGAINAAWLNVATLVPVPPSKARGHPDYDDRMTVICRNIALGIDVREIVIQRNSLQAAHESGTRPTISELLAEYQIDQAVATPAPRRIGIVDDVLTAGTHYVAVKTMLQRHYPGVPIVGFFVARRVFPV
jgi:predicted amidophosphoribosyltransferase